MACRATTWSCCELGGADVTCWRLPGGRVCGCCAGTACCHCGCRTCLAHPDHAQLTLAIPHACLLSTAVETSPRPLPCLTSTCRAWTSFAGQGRTILQRPCLTTCCPRPRVRSGWCGRVGGGCRLPATARVAVGCMPCACSPQTFSHLPPQHTHPTVFPSFFLAALLGEGPAGGLEGVDQPPASQTPQSSAERSGSLGGGAAPKTKPRRRGGKKHGKPTVDDLETLQIRGRVRGHGGMCRETSACARQLAV